MEDSVGTHTGHPTQAGLTLSIAGSVTPTRGTPLSIVWLTPTASMEGSITHTGHFTQDGPIYPDCEHGWFWRHSHAGHSTHDDLTYPKCEHGGFWRHTNTGHLSQDGLTYPDCEHGGFWRHSHTGHSAQDGLHLLQIHLIRVILLLHISCGIRV